MELEVVTIGNELLLGFTIDTNGAYIAQELGKLGASVTRRVTVPDTPDAIRDAVAAGLQRTRFVICTGGLGPTRDDLTKKTVADLFGAPLVLDETYLEALRQRFLSWGIGPMPESNRTQAEVPRGATVLNNRWGSAPGLWLSGEAGEVVLLPGVPREMQGLLTHEVRPRLEERLASEATVNASRTLRTVGVSESGLADQLEGIEEQLSPLTLAFLPELGGVDLRLTAWQMPPGEADRRLGEGVAMLAERLGEACYGEGEIDLAEPVVSGLRERGWKLAVAESCTGGLVGGRVTRVAGASDVFVGGVIAYSNAVKRDLLGVPASVLEQHGAVSEETARAMAEGVAARFGTEAAISVTGIAGPGGGTDEKPVGTVYVAARAGGVTRVAGRVMPGGRREVRARSVLAALNLLRLMIRQ